MEILNLIWRDIKRLLVSTLKYDSKFFLFNIVVDRFNIAKLKL